MRRLNQGIKKQDLMMAGEDAQHQNIPIRMPLELL
jgi:hypothetical protein